MSTTDGMDYDPSKQVFEIWEDLVVCRMATSLVLWGVWTSLGLKLIEKELNMLDFIFQSLYILEEIILEENEKRSSSTMMGGTSKSALP